MNARSTATLAAGLFALAVTVLPVPPAAAATGQITGIGGKSRRGRRQPRHRPCSGAAADSCSGVPQQNWEFTRIFAAYAG